MRLHSSLSIPLILCLSLLAGGSLTAQTPEDTGLEITAVPPAEVIGAASELDARLDELASELERALTPPIDELRPDLRELGKEIQTDQRSLASVAEGGLEELQAREERWQFYGRRLEALGDVLSDRIAALDVARNELELLRSRWRATRLAARGEAALAGVINSALQKIQRQLAEVRESRRESLELQAQIPRLGETIQDAKRNIDSVRAQRFDRLLQREAAPAWSGEFWAAPDGSPFAALSSGELLPELSDLTKLADRFRFLRFGLPLLLFALLVRHRSGSREPLIAAAVYLTVVAGLLAHSVNADQVRFAALLAAGPLILRTRLRLPLLGFVLLAVVYRLRGPGPGAHLLVPVVYAAMAALVYHFAARAGQSQQASLQMADRAFASPTLTNAVPRVLIVCGGAFVLALALYLVGFRELGVLIGKHLFVALELAVLALAALMAGTALLKGVLALPRLHRINFLAQRRQTAIHAGRRGITLVLALLWGLAVLQSVSLLEPLVNFLSAILAAGLSVGSIEITVGDVVAFALTIYVSFRLSRFVRALLREDLFTRADMGRGVPYAISSITHYAILLIGLAIALTAAGFDLSKLALVAGALGVGIGFGLQNIVNNFVSGLILLLERPVQIGDFVLVDGLMGEVRRIGLRASRIRIIDGSEVIVPNSHFISEKLTNWTLSDHKRRLDIPVGVAYGTETEPVLNILTEAAREHADVLAEPAPLPLFVGFGDSSLDFRLLVWTAQFERRLVIESELRAAILAKLNAAGIEIPFPQRDVHLYTESPDGGAKLPKQLT